MPVRETVPKVQDELAVGEDLEFQWRWWKFERAAWFLFLAILICDVLGMFGQGWFAHSKMETPNKDLTLSYDRVSRASSPSTLGLQFSPRAVHDGQVRVFVSGSVVKQLGAQRIAPQPSVTEIGSGGLTYTFPVTTAPAAMQISLEPEQPGLYHFYVRVLGDAAEGSSLSASTVVLP